jgi:alkylation response protein AidB-like acyl-CoA dehydrogenase
VVLTPEQIEIRDLARDFAAGEIRTRAGHWDEHRRLDEDIFAKLGELGFLGMLVPEEHGGLELDLTTYLLVLEQLAWGDASVALSVGIQNGPLVGLILAHGTDEQKERWLPELASGSLLGAFALSERAAGSDAAALAARAFPAGDGWRLEGRKKWVTNGDRAGVILVFARLEGTDHDPAPMGAFLVDRSAHGYEVGRREKTMGLRASQTVEVVLDSVAVDGERLISLPDDGFVSVLRALDLARLGDAAISVGIGQSAFEHATAYALERHQFGTAIADFGAIQAKLADMATRIAGARALTLDVASRFSAARQAGNVRGPTGSSSLRASAAMAKLNASQAALWVADEAVQIFGGYGYMRDYPVEKLLRDAKGTEILEGTSEIMRVAIAREVIKEAKEA